MSSNMTTLVDIAATTILAAAPTAPITTISYLPLS